MLDTTVTYNNEVDGWPSFYSFYPDYMIGMNNSFYTFKGGNLYLHHSNDRMNNFYGVQHKSIIKSVFNDSPLSNKVFKILNLESNDTWKAIMETDIQDSGIIEAEWFEKKEQAYYAFVRNNKDNEYALRYINGIGNSVSITGNGSNVEVNFSIYIESILSVGDIIYFALPPYNTPILFGKLINIEVDYPNNVNRLIIDTTISGATMPSIQDPYIMYVKNSVAESHGVTGHYCIFTIENGNDSDVEIFTVNSEVSKSYP